MTEITEISGIRGLCDPNSRDLRNVESLLTEIHEISRTFRFVGASIFPSILLLDTPLVSSPDDSLSCVP